MSCIADGFTSLTASPSLAHSSRYECTWRLLPCGGGIGTGFFFDLTCTATILLIIIIVSVMVLRPTQHENSGALQIKDRSPQ